MSKPIRNADAANILSSSRTFFVTTKTSMGRRLLQSERNATLLIDALRANVKAKKFRVHDFVVMPDHVHLLITIDRELSIERAMRLIKGGFSYRLKREFGHSRRGLAAWIFGSAFNGRQRFLRHREYIAQNPVEAGLVSSPNEFPYCYSYLAKQEAAGAKAHGIGAAYGTTEVVP